MRFKNYTVKGALLFKHGGNIKFTTEVSLDDPKNSKKILEILKSKYKAQFPNEDFGVHLIKIILPKDNQLEIK